MKIVVVFSQVILFTNCLGLSSIKQHSTMGTRRRPRLDKILYYNIPVMDSWQESLVSILKWRYNLSTIVNSIAKI